MPNNVFISHPSILYQAHLFNTSLTQIFQECNMSPCTLLSGQTVLFPTFSGNYLSGHWFLSIIQKIDDHISGFIIDSLGYSCQRNEYVVQIFQHQNMNIRWQFCKTILHTEVECGPRTILHMCDIVDQIS